MAPQFYRYAAFACASLALGGCGGDADSPDVAEALYQNVASRKTVEVGGGTPQRLRFGVDEQIELDIPADVTTKRVRVQVSLVTGTARRGVHPVNDAGLLVEPQGLRFAVPARIRQPLPPLPPSRSYVAVVIPDKQTTFVARKPARRVSGPDRNGLEVWEGEGDSSGLWGFADVEAP